MNLLQLVFKQMRQRALSTWLTMLSIMLGVALAVAILILYREGAGLFMQKNFGYEIIVGPPKGSPLQLVINTVYQIDQSPGNMPYKVYEDLLRNRQDVKLAVPYAVGDSYKGLRIIGTSPKLFGFTEEGEEMPEKFEYQRGRSYRFSQGRVFHALKFEAIIGSDVLQRVGLKLGDTFRASHGLPPPGQEEEEEHDTEWTVVGVLEKTNTPADRSIFIPLISFYAIEDHGEALEQQAEMKQKIQAVLGLPPAPAQAPPATTEAHDDHADHDEEDEHDHHDHLFHVNDDGTIDLHLPKDRWVVSAVLVKSRGEIGAGRLIYRYRVIDPQAIAVVPAEVMRQFFNAFLKNTTLVLLLISVLVIIVAAIGVLVSIYNSVSARMREIAILRALGATRRKILTLICFEAGLVGLIAGVVGTIAGHMIAAAGAVYLHRVLGTSVEWFRFDRYEAYTIAGVVLLAVLAGLVPAMKAYRTPVATNLVAG